MADGSVTAAETTEVPPSILIFIAADVGSFILFFAVFMAERLDKAAAFARSASHLNLGIGLANTIILLTSGWLVALAVGSSRIGAQRRARQLVIVAALIGTLFVALKAWEYAEKFRQGIGITTDAFFAYYYVLTGLHLFHVVVGLVVLVAMANWLRRGDGRAVQARVQSGALYWHMVDLLWIFLFPLLYLQAS